MSFFTNKPNNEISKTKNNKVFVDKKYQTIDAYQNNNNNTTDD